jgi:hypothetical protein
MIVISVIGLYNNEEISMTETKIFHKNWKYKDILMKDLIDFGFPLPAYSFEYKEVYSLKDFNNISGLKAVYYG